MPAAPFLVPLIPRTPPPVFWPLLLATGQVSRRIPGILPGGTVKPVIFVPTYNEAPNLERLVGEIRGILPEATILVVDDRSPDGTGQIADRVAAADPAVRVLHRDPPKGRGLAGRDGYLEALRLGADVVIEMDADFSHDPAYLPELLEVAAGDVDLAIGSRYVRGVNVINWPMSRLLLSWSANKYAHFVTGLPLKDATSGFKCFRREVLEAIDFKSVGSTGYTFQIEMDYRAWKKGFRLGEVPIVFTDRAEGQSKMSGAIMREAVWRVWSLRLRSLFRRL